METSQKKIQEVCIHHFVFSTVIKETWGPSSDGRNSGGGGSREKAIYICDRCNQFKIINS